MPSSYIPLCLQVSFRVSLGVLIAMVRGYLQTHVHLTSAYRTAESISPSPKHQLPINPQGGVRHYKLLSSLW